jgi:hypothetical protein
MKSSLQALFAADMYQLGIELCAGSDSEYAMGDSRPRFRIGDAWHLNGVERVRNRKDSCLERDERSSYAIWVSRSIPSFMVMCNDHRRVSEKSVRLKSLGSDSRMAWTTA